MSINPNVKLCQNQILCSLNHHISLISSFVLLNHHVCHIFAPFFPIFWGSTSNSPCLRFFFEAAKRPKRPTQRPKRLPVWLPKVSRLFSRLSHLDVAGDDIWLLYGSLGVIMSIPFISESLYIFIPYIPFTKKYQEYPYSHIPFGKHLRTGKSPCYSWENSLFRLGHFQ